MDCIVFPPEVHGSIKPGSLDHLTKVYSIEWGVNMTGLIEPGTIPRCCTVLLLPPSYKHPITDRLGPRTIEYVHHSNLGTVQHDRQFQIWKTCDEPNPCVPTAYDCNQSWVGSRYFRHAWISMARRLPVTVPQPEPVTAPQGSTTNNIDALITLSKSQESNSHTLFAKRTAIRITEEMTEAAIDGYLHTNFRYEFDCPTPLQPTILVLQELLGPKLTVKPDDSDEPGIIITLTKN